MYAMMARTCEHRMFLSPSTDPWLCCTGHALLLLFFSDVTNSSRLSKQDVVLEVSSARILPLIIELTANNCDGKELEGTSTRGSFVHSTTVIASMVFNMLPRKVQNAKTRGKTTPSAFASTTGWKAIRTERFVDRIAAGCHRTIVLST